MPITSAPADRACRARCRYPTPDQASSAAVASVPVSTTVESGTAKGATRNHSAAADIAVMRRPSQRTGCCGNDSTDRRINPAADTVKSSARPVSTLPNVASEYERATIPSAAATSSQAANPIDDERSAAIEIQQAQHRRGKQCRVCGDQPRVNRDRRRQRDAGKVVVDSAELTVEACA